MTEKNGDVLKGLFIGGLIGIALGILFAPKAAKKHVMIFYSKPTKCWLV